MELSTSDLLVRVCAQDDSGTYIFRCPACQMSVVKPAERRIIELLVASGVPLQSWDLPAELTEPRPTLGPLTHDDLIDFHQFLQDEDWFDALFLSGR
ncbi:MAG: hypothetical protein AB7L84_03300 [Acidimicrobiia bacterium]